MSELIKEVGTETVVSPSVTDVSCNWPTESMTFIRRHNTRLAGTAAMATWTLKRERQVQPLTDEHAVLLTGLTASGSIGKGELRYDDAAVRLRPSVISLLRPLWQAPTTDFAVSHLSMAVYGRAVSMRAIRQTVFRINRALENVGCPIFVHCQHAKVFLRPRFWSF